MSEMHSDHMPDPQDIQSEEQPRQVTGRTFWDLMSGKGLLVLLLAVSAVGISVVYLNRDSIDWTAVRQFIVDYWFVALGPIVGTILGKLFADAVHQPVCRVVLVLDPESHTVRALVIPEKFFRFLNQTGNNVVYHSPLGTPVYLAADVDLSRGFVDYGWVHEHDALVVFTKEKFYCEWNGTLNRAMEDNLKMMDNPQVYGLRYAGQALKRHLGRVSASVGVRDPDASAGPSDYAPNTGDHIPEEGSDEQGH